MAFPSPEELEREYGHLLDDPAILAITAWSEANHDGPMDEEAYLERALRTGPALLERLEDAVDSLMAAEEGRETDVSLLTS